MDVGPSDVMARATYWDAEDRTPPAAWVGHWPPLTPPETPAGERTGSEGQRDAPGEETSEERGEAA